jgi:hypothetical protein
MEQQTISTLKNAHIPHWALSFGVQSNSTALASPNPITPNLSSGRGLSPHRVAD